MKTRRLPPARKLATEILSQKVGKQTLAESMAFLLSKRFDLEKFASVESFVLAEGAQRISGHAGCEYHLLQARIALARELWSRQLFIGVSVLDELLFDAIAHQKSAEPLLRVLETIRDEGLHHPGLVIFPVHSFGILSAGLLDWFTEARLDFVSSAFGIALSPQTNDMAATLAFLEKSRAAFGVKKPIDGSLIKHWCRSRSAHWLTSNPLLVVKAQSFPGGYYENQWLLVSKLRASAALISMLACLQPERRLDDEERAAKLFSSAAINNFQTLDFKHYIVLFNTPKKQRLVGDCIPMHLRAPALAEVSDLGIELHPQFWTRRNVLADRIHRCVSSVHNGYIRYSMKGLPDDTLARTYRKLYEALVFFRRSFQKSDNDWGAIISLAIAFEMCLTDSYAPGVTKRVVRRTRLLLRGVRGIRAYVRAVDNLYSARGAVVHSGSTDLTTDFVVTRRAFVNMFVALVERLPNLAVDSTSPMKDLTGDRR